MIKSIFKYLLLCTAAFLLLNPLHETSGDFCSPAGVVVSAGELESVHGEIRSTSKGFVSYEGVISPMASSVSTLPFRRVQPSERQNGGFFFTTIVANSFHSHIKSLCHDNFATDLKSNLSLHGRRYCMYTLCRIII